MQEADADREQPEHRDHDRDPANSTARPAVSIASEHGVVDLEPVGEPCRNRVSTNSA